MTSSEFTVLQQTDSNFKRISFQREQYRHQTMQVRIKTGVLAKGKILPVRQAWQTSKAKKLIFFQRLVQTNHSNFK